MMALSTFLTMPSFLEIMKRILSFETTFSS